MGRRVTSTTKGGRYMNPADQERKITRRRELKKNKKQRLMVRQAVLKSKDPEQLIEEMEKLDNMQYNPNEEPPISERVITEKKSKLRETYVRVMCMFKQENEMEKFHEVKKKLNEYDQRKTQLEQHYIAIKFAREVDPGEIPLPDAVPPGASIVSNSVVGVDRRKRSGARDFEEKIAFSNFRSKSTVPPGVPIGPPPDLSDDDDDDELNVTHSSQQEEGETSSISDEGEINRRGGDDDDFDDEEGMDDDQGPDDKGGKRRTSKVRFNAAEEDEEKDTRTKYKKLAKMVSGDRAAIGPSATFGQQSNMGVIGPMAPMGGMPPPQMMPPYGLPMRMPLPPALMRGGAPNFQRPFVGPSYPPSNESTGVISSGPVLSAPPAVVKPPKTTNHGPVIEAKAQLRSIQHDVTKFVPTGVKIRLDKGLTGPATGHNSSAAKSKGPIAFRVQASNAAQAAQKAKARTTDDAYDEFMKEMKDIM
uniref:WW domain-binding protein 11 n=1 Tax=Romanomermis culicivorax TaxID=13658 RepID=A0A915J4B1_ROMCU